MKEVLLSFKSRYVLPKSNKKVLVVLDDDTFEVDGKITHDTRSLCIGYVKGKKFYIGNENGTVSDKIENFSKVVYTWAYISEPKEVEE